MGPGPSASPDFPAPRSAPTRSSRRAEARKAAVRTLRLSRQYLPESLRRCSIFALVRARDRGRNKGHIGRVRRARALPSVQRARYGIEIWGRPLGSSLRVDQPGESGSRGSNSRHVPRAGTRHPYSSDSFEVRPPARRSGSKASQSSNHSGSLGTARRCLRRKLRSHRSMRSRVGSNHLRRSLREVSSPVRATVGAITSRLKHRICARLILKHQICTRATDDEASFRCGEHRGQGHHQSCRPNDKRNKDD